MMRVILAIGACGLAAGCGTPPVLFGAPSAALSVEATPADPGSRIGVPYRAIEVRQVSLPSYADTDAIFVEGAGGTLTPARGAEWADVPSRAITLDLVGVLDAVTRARVAAEPWPYDTAPEARVEVRATRMAAGVDGLFRISGQYHVADLRLDEETPRDRSGLFTVAVPFDYEAGVTAVAEARSRAVRDLARQIASEGM